MNAPTIVASCLVLFAGTHLALGFPPLRPRLVSRLGERRFVALFSGIAGLSLLLLAVAVHRVGDQGPPMPQPTGFIRGSLVAVAVCGWLLAMAAIDSYARSPMALFRTRFAPPSGIQIVTRHGFFVGLAGFATAHALLVPTLAQAVYFWGFAALSLIGAIWQDQKLLRRHGQAYAEFMTITSVIPFVAVLRGRQRLSIPSWRQCWRPLGLTVTIVALHPWLSSANGAWFAALLGAGGVYISLRRGLAAEPRSQTP